MSWLDPEHGGMQTASKACEPRRSSSDLADGGAWWTVRCGGRGDVCTGGVYRDEAEMSAPDGGHAVSGRTYAR